MKVEFRQASNGLAVSLVAETDADRVALAAWLAAKTKEYDEAPTGQHMDGGASGHCRFISTLCYDRYAPRVGPDVLSFGAGK
jgi:hypothetical protein